MTLASQQIVSKAWNFAHVLRDDGLSYMAYTEPITFLLFLEMADELTKLSSNRKDQHVKSLLKINGQCAIAAEIVDDLQTALSQFTAIEAELKR